MLQKSPKHCTPGLVTSEVRRILVIAKMGYMLPVKSEEPE